MIDLSGQRTHQRRRLAAIMFTDMVGYTALGQRNESLSLALVDKHRELIRPILANHEGLEVKTMGDAFLVEFGSALEAVRCAYEVQRAIREFNISMPEERRIHLRVGIHLGDVVESGGDISGDAVNIASRIVSIADDGGVCLSRQVYDQVHNKFELPAVSLGLQSPKNLSTPIEVFRVQMPWKEEEAAPVALDQRRIAVLPFANISPDPSDEYFADGMTEELITTMSKISGLKVIARTSVNHFKGSQKGISEIARELQAGSVLEGSVRRAGDRIRVTVQLVDSRSSEHTWAESYDRELTDVLAIQGDISKSVAETLRVKLLSHEDAKMRKKGAVNPEAYALYLRGRHLWNQRTKSETSEAVGCFEEAVRVHPDFAPAYAGLADCYNVLADYGWMAPDRASKLAKDFSTKALEIDPDLAEAHASLGWTLMSYFWEFTSAEREFRRAIDLRPSYAIAHHWHAILLTYMRKSEEALQEEEKAFELDPYSRSIRVAVANCKAILGRKGEAIEGLRILAEMEPTFSPSHYWAAEIRIARKEYEEALIEARKAVELDGAPGNRAQLARACALAGRKGEAHEILEEILPSAKTGLVPPTVFGLARLAEGDMDDGFEWFERAFTAKDASILMLGSLPWLQDYYSDPRWVEIDERARLALGLKS